IIAERAEPYTWAKDHMVHAVRMENGVSRAGDGGMLLSALDIGPWRTALATGKLVPTTALARAWRPAPLNTGRAAPYNYGQMHDETRGRRLQVHTGSVPGFLSAWASLPDQGVSALAVANYDGPKGPSLRRLAFAALEAAAPGA